MYHKQVMSVKDASEKLEVVNDYYRGQVRNLFAQINRLSNGCESDKDNNAFITRILSYKDNMLKIAVVIDCFIAYLNNKVEPDRIAVPDVDDVNNLRAINQNLDETLSGVSKIMQELHDEWKDGGWGEEVVEEFQTLCNRFIDESEDIESYADFLSRKVGKND